MDEGSERGDVCVGVGKGAERGGGRQGAQFSVGRAYLLCREHCTVPPIIKYALRSGM